MSGARRFFIGSAVAASLFALRMLLLAISLLLQRVLGGARVSARTG